MAVALVNTNRAQLRAGITCMGEKKRNRLAQGVADAAAIIEAKGWCKGGLRDQESRVCMMGGVLEAFQDEATTVRHKAYELINAALGVDMTKWNDSQNTPSKVVEKLREIASSIGEWTPKAFCSHGVALCSCGVAIGCHSWEGPSCCFSSRDARRHKAGCKEAK